MKERSHHSIDLSEIRLHYVEQGEGPTVVFLHGFPATWYTWVPIMNRLSKSFRVVCPDLRGYNLSGRPTGVANYTPDKIAGDIVEFIDYLGEPEVPVVGHDWGGVIAYYLGAHFPRRVSRLAVLNAPHPKALVWHLKHNFKQLKRSWYILFFQLPWLPEFLIGRNIDGFLKSVYRPKSAFSPTEISHYRRALLLPGALTAALNYYRASGRAVLTRQPPWPAIECPSLLLWGVKDSALGQELTDGMERYFQGSLRKEFLSDAGHWVHSEKPETVSGLLSEFLN